MGSWTMILSNMDSCIAQAYLINAGQTAIVQYYLMVSASTVSIVADVLWIMSSLHRGECAIWLSLCIKVHV